MAFDIKYIISTNVKNILNHFLNNKIFEMKYWIFSNIIFVKMKIRKLINYSTNMNLPRYYNIMWKITKINHFD
jgi:hypothetical protein